MISLNKAQQQNLISNLWRLHPARMAEHVTKGEFIRYAHIEKISRLIARGIIEGNARFIISSPPRHGKSYLISKWTPTWFLSRWPKKKVILASYESSFAASWGRQVRNILQENEELGVSIAQDSHAADKWDTTVGGGMFTTGTGGPLTGKGGDCFPGSTLISTLSGNKDICQIKEGEYVWSFNHKNRIKELRRVEAIKSRRVSKLVRIKSACGREVSCTPNHAIWSEDRGYTAAIHLKADGLIVERRLSQNKEGNSYSSLLSLPKDFQKTFLRIYKSIKKNTQRFLLFNVLLSISSCIQKPRLNRKSYYSMFDLSYHSSQIDGDTVSSVEELSDREIDVYDIQVEGNHNFFANGILVHNCLIIDDPVKNSEEADSPTYRQKAIDWWNTTFRTRAEPRSSIILLMTRWHESDLAGYLTSKENENRDEWTIINLPAIAESNEDWMGRKQGEALCPERFDITALEDIKRSVGPRAWTALYQGSPAPPGGALFTSEMFDFVDLPAQFDYRFITADTAFNDKTSNDFTVFTAFGVIKDQIYILDVFRRQIKAADIEGPAISFINQFSGYGFRGAYIEPKGHGIYLNQVFPRRGISVPSETLLKQFFEDRKWDKVARANNAVPHLYFRRVHINRQISNKEVLLNELLLFPNARFDDFTDTVIDGIKFVYGMNKVSICDVL